MKDKNNIQCVAMLPVALLSFKLERLTNGASASPANLQSFMQG